MTQTDWTQELSSWIRLEQTPGVGSETARKLLGAFGPPENVFTASFSSLHDIVSERIARALTAPLNDEVQARIEKTIEWAQQPGNRVITLGDAAYPKTLLDIPDPPLMLYAKGRLELLASPALAVVGSRNATTQGIVNAENFSKTLSQSGLSIISGLALGIDTAAHRGGLQAYGSTVAVIGTGADIVYPARNRSLAHQIAAEGCIISEYPLGTPPMAANFPRRNRIISGLARGVLVIEAAAQSGSLITARMAAEQGRDVLAIPGSIHSPLAKGCHLLIKQGAKLVESAQDVLEEIGHYASHPEPSTMTSTPDCDPEAVRILNVLGFDPLAPDALAARCQIGIADLHAQLLTLELDGCIEMLPGGMVRRLVTP